MQGNLLQDNGVDLALAPRAGQRTSKGSCFAQNQFRADHYVYGALNNQGLMRGSKLTEKGKAAEAKHAAHQKKAMETLK